MNERKDSIGSILRSNDPARDGSLDANDAQLMRSRILNETTPDTRTSRLRPMLAFATFLVAIAGSWLVFETRTRPEPVAPTTPIATIETTPSEPSVVDKTAVRQVQYTTPGGTRVIWTLDPDFQL